MKLIFKITLLYLSFPYLSLIAQEKSNGIIQLSPSWDDDSIASSSVNDYIHLYQHFISESRGVNCAMYPSCSDYGIKVFKERPFYEAMLLTSDRLTRCSHDRKYYSRTYQFNRLKLLDYPPYQKAPKNLEYHGTHPYTTEYHRNDSTILFIETLINKGSYSVALLEIERILFLKKSNSVFLYHNKLLCYEALGREEDAIYEYEMRLPDSIKNNSTIQLDVAKLFFKLDNYADSKAILSKILENPTADSDVLRKAYSLQGIIALSEDNYTLAKRMFLESNNYSLNKKLLAQNLELLSEVELQKKKSPRLARFISIVPGLGYAYTNQKQNALTAFIINTLLSYATYTSIKSKNYGVAGLMGTFAVSFYGGNILGAGNSAKKYNQKLKRKNINKLSNINQIIYY